MISASQLTAFLRGHAQPRNLDQLPRPIRDLFPSPEDHLSNASFYVTDTRNRYYFEFIDVAGAGHIGNVVLVAQRSRTITLLANRGGTGDIWESVLLPIARIEYVALRSKQGRL